MTICHPMTFPPARRYIGSKKRTWCISVACSSSALMFILAIAGCANAPPPDIKRLRYAEEVVGTNREELQWNFHSILEYTSSDNDFAPPNIGSGTNNGKTDFCTIAKYIQNAVTDEKPVEIRGLGLQFPGYLIGIEKAQREILGLSEGAFSECNDTVANTIFRQSFLNPFLLETQTEESVCFMKRRLDDGLRTFLSHIVAFRSNTRGALPRVTGSLLYNVYTQSDLLCNVQEAKTSGRPVTYEKGIFRNGHEGGLQTLKASLKNDLENGKNLGTPYSHIFVYVMGWNTAQAESIENFNNLFGYMLDAAEKDNSFKPLILGISWPSAWSFGTSPWDDFIRGVSLWNKKNDADELGATWSNYLLNDVIANIKLEYPSLRVVLIGHSFGARVATRTLYSCNLLPQPKSCSNTIDLVIGLQSAFGRSRFGNGVAPTWQESFPFLPLHHEGMPFTDFSGIGQFSAQQAYLWSRYDSATSLTAMMGGANAIEHTLDRSDVFTHLPDNKYVPGEIPHSDDLIKSVQNFNPETSKKTALLMDGSGIVRHDTPYHGGGSHSDIYTREIGRLTWELVKKFAPARLPKEGGAK